MAQLIDIKRICSVNLPEGVKDGRYKNNHKNDTCVKDWYFILLDFDGRDIYRFIFIKRCIEVFFNPLLIKLILCNLRTFSFSFSFFFF